MDGDTFFTRRGLLSTTIGAGLVATTGGILIPQDKANAAASPPRQGGRIRAACMSLSTADTLDPAKGTLSSDYVRHFMLYNCLTELDQHLRSVPSLAERIESEDQRVWQVRLRKGISFHNGKSLNSDDVVYSLLRHKRPDVASRVAAIAEQFKSIRPAGPFDLVIELNGPNADLPAILGQSHFAIVPAGETHFRSGNGTGPYRLKAFAPGVRTVGERNVHYWKTGKPYLDEIELIGIPDEVSRVNALLSGDIHMALAVNPRSTRRVNASPGHIVREVPSSLYTNLIMRQDRLPTANPHFVTGMKYLMDRPLIKRALFRNYATIANDQPIPPFHPYYRADLPQTTLDLDKARWHFRKAGIGASRLPVYASPAAEGSVDMASILQEYGARAGLNLAITRVPADGYWSTHWMKHPLSFGNTNPRPTVDLTFSLFYTSNAPNNESGWTNARFDSLLREARGEADEGRRKQLYGEMQGLVKQYCGSSIPVFINLIDAYDRRLKGWYPVPLGGFMGYGFAEHLWWEA